MPTQRPGLDNYAKLVIDALSPSKPGYFGVWLDDSQVVDMTVPVAPGR